MSEKLKIYVAAPFVHRTDAAAAKAKFEAAGFEVTSRWITEDLGLTNDDVGKPEFDAILQRTAIQDVEDVIAADVFVLLNLAKSEGKATEFGFAYGLGISTIIVGQRAGNVFYLLPNVFRVDTVEEVITAIREAIEKNDELSNFYTNAPEVVQ